MTGYGYWTDKGIFQVAFGSYQNGRYIIRPGNEGSNWYDIFPVFDPGIMYVGSRLITFDNGEGYEVTRVAINSGLIWADKCKVVDVKYTETNRTISTFLVYNEDGSSLGLYGTIIIMERPPYPEEWPSRLTGYVDYTVRDVYEQSTFSQGTTDAPYELLPSFPRSIGELPNDPFGPGGNSGTGGGDGSFDNTSTPIEIPNLPSISAASTGFISLFNPSLSQLNELSSYLWSDLFEIDGWKKLFADPMDAILGLSILPVAIPSGGTREVKVGNIGTGISLTVAASQFVEVDCGSIDVNEYWGAYLDYEPFTQAQIFLPYIGTRPISVDEIMGKTVRVVYHVDILTGACCCFVKCEDSVLYTYNGQCSIPIPINGANYTSVVNGVISIAASVGSLVATGGASAPTAIPSIASSVVNQMKPQIEKSGSISGSAGVLNMQTPYLILIRPRQALPSDQNKFIGYPSLITVQLTELSGYTEVQSIHLENIPATQEELAEIQSLLEGGVIF